MTPPALARRSDAPEIMDGGGLGFEEVAACLRELAWINRVTLAYHPTLRWVARALAQASGRRLTLLDVGCGYGDMLRRLHARFGDRLELVGVDANPLATRAAREATPPGTPVRYETSDVFRYAAERSFDLIVSSLFCHHLDDDGLRRFVRWMEERASVG